MNKIQYTKIQFLFISIRVSYKIKTADLDAPNLPFYLSFCELQNFET